MKKKLLFILIVCIFITGCANRSIELEWQPLLKHGDFFIGTDAEGNTFYVDYSEGVLSIIGHSRTALEKYVVDMPILLATSYDTDEIIKAGQQESQTDGIAVGNLYITSDEIIAFNASELSIMERLQLKKIGVTRISDYDEFVEKQTLLWEAVSDIAEYRATIDLNENPVLYKEDRIVYYESDQIYLKNVSGLYEEPVSLRDFYDRFIQDQGRIELLRRSNNLHEYICLVFDESLVFISDSGHLTFRKEEA